jgi:hypothetical protein
MLLVLPVAPAGSARPSMVRIGGQPMLHKAVSQATEVVGHAVTVVLGAYADQLAPLLKHTTASVVINRNWQEGQIPCDWRRQPARQLRWGAGSRTGQRHL